MSNMHYVIIKVNNHHFFIMHTYDLFNYVCIYAVQFKTPTIQHFTPAFMIHIDYSINDINVVGVIPMAHEAKMLYCITDTVRRTSF